MEETQLPEGEKKQQILEALSKGQKIQAIKIYRELTGCDLKTAKEKMDALGEELAQKHPDQFPKPGKAGCATVLAAGLLVGLLSLALVVAALSV